VVALAGALTLGVAQLGAAASTSGTQAAGTAPATVVLIGDSLMHQAASGIRAALPGSTVVDGSIPGTGLLNGAVDWSSQAAALVALYHPDVVVVSFVGNYDQSEGKPRRRLRRVFAAWAAAAQKLTDELRTSVARVDWVAQPPLRDQNFYGVAPIRTDLLLAQYQRLAYRSGRRARERGERGRGGGRLVHQDRVRLRAHGRVADQRRRAFHVGRR